MEYLLRNGADINKQSNFEATAMHYAVQGDNIEIVEMLLAFNAQQLKNNQCILFKFGQFTVSISSHFFLALTPILVAAERTQFCMVNYLLVTLNLTREEIIEAEELLAASYLDDQNIHYNKLGFYIMLHSMELRLEIE